jgi:O-antigen/teichoic acid export membrane protein
LKCPTNCFDEPIALQTNGYDSCYCAIAGLSAANTFACFLTTRLSLFFVGDKLKHAGAKSILLNASQVTAARILATFLRVIYIVFLARQLGPELYGLLVYGLSWYMALLPLASLGLDAIIVREAGRERTQNVQLLRKLFSLRVLAAIMIGLVCAVAGWLVDTEASLLLVILSIALMGRSISLAAEQIFAGFEASRYTLIQESYFRPLEVGFGIVILLAGGGILAIATWHSFVWVLQAVRGLRLVQSKFFEFRFESLWKAFAPFLREAMLLLLSGFAYTWMFQGPIVMYRQFGADQTILGAVGLVFQAFAIICIVPWALVRAALPIIARATKRDDGNDIFFAKPMIRLAFLLGGLAGFAAEGLGTPLVALLFGEDYSLAGELLASALWLLLPMTAGVTLYTILIARSRSFELFSASLVGAIVVTVLVYVLPPLLGPAGIFIGTGAGLTSWFVAMMLAFARSERLALLRAFLFSASVVTLAVILGYGALGLGVSEWICIPIALLVVLAGVPTTALLEPDERQLIKSLLGRA